ncbi:MAG: alpha-L-fucosidase [Chitinophaga sp.]|uniref:alpha-L-fucosidase n=1 Tax=Chitinophaga sp. TaxID=1869181 RepID=UPI0025B9EDBC|nr:alpha-L-fucosidase [Chitinophaga sp.]MBV8252072.1 alpha-L-fucosidase [Chitinophaga sp.]
MIVSHVAAQQQAPNWEQLSKEYRFPKWFTEAKLGIWVHWGAQSLPDSGGGWYARHMYMQDVGNQKFGANAYPYHLRHFGHPSEKGFKDVIHEWKAERLNTDSLMRYFKHIGARYFVALASHHDHFDNFNSTYHAWNTVNVGPHKDIIGLFRQSATKYHMPFGVSSHDDRFMSWWLPAFGADTSGPKKGVKYDGYLTKADGVGKWWEGLDPADLYGLPPEKRTPEWIESVKKNWLDRHVELVTKYDVDMLWFDGYGFPYGNYGKEASTKFLQQHLQKHHNLSVVVAGKIQEEPMVLRDIERGGSAVILPYPWQGTMTFTHWFYKKEIPSRHNARTVIESFTDMISKNGNLLLNVELLPDGTIPADHKLILDTIGWWMNRNKEAIYGSSPWQTFGDNFHGIQRKRDVSITDAEAAQQHGTAEDFNERTIKSPMYSNQEVRFTVNKGNLYVFVLNPTGGNLLIPALGLTSTYHPGNIRKVSLLGSKQKIAFKQDEEGLQITVPSEAGEGYTAVFKIEGKHFSQR